VKVSPGSTRGAGGGSIGRCGIALSGDLHHGLGDRRESVQHIDGNNEHIPSSAAARLLADRDIHLTGHDAQDLLAVIKMSRPTHTGTEPTDG